MIEKTFIYELDKVLTFGDKDFFDNFAFIMHSALIKDLSLYTDLIDEMYEICERDRDILADILERAQKDRQLVIELNKKDDNVNPLSFGYKLGEAISDVCKNQFGPGEYLALGCVAESFISYKKNWLNKDEYYEIRDMFVPFYLPISVTMLDVEAVINSFKESNIPNSDGMYSFALLKKIGRTVVDNTVTLDDIKEALLEINFDEAW